MLNSDFRYFNACIYSADLMDFNLKKDICYLHYVIINN